MNAYDSEHPIQKAFNATNGHCLCTMREECDNCSSENYKAWTKAIEAALDAGYTLYHRKWNHVAKQQEWRPLDMEYVASNFQRGFKGKVD